MSPPDWRPVLARYPSAVAGLTWAPLGSAGGFSGAAVWRGDAADGPALALKAWPAGYPADRLAEVHRWMAAARVRAGLPFVPAVVPIASGETLVEHAGRVWDVTAWMPGTADFHADPSDAKLSAACAALAALHRAWCPPQPELIPCPGVLRRLALLGNLAAAGVNPAARQHPPDEPRGLTPRQADPLRRALDLLPSRARAAAAALAPWVGRPLPCFPCLCDVWHDHVLFTGDRVTGVIDYGAMRPDHPAVDLARLLGDLVGGDPGRVRFALDAYRAAGGPVPVSEELVLLLDRTGVVCAVANWVLRLASGAPPPPVAARLGRLVDRLEGVFGG